MSNRAAAQKAASDLPNDVPALPDSLEFLRMLWAVNHGIERNSRSMEESLGLTAQQRMVIRLIGHTDEIFAGPLAEILRVDPGTLSAAIKRLEKRGLVKRRADTEDRRRVRLTLSPKGKSLDRPADGTIEGAVSKALADIPSAKVKVAREVLAALVAQLESQLGEEEPKARRVAKR
jgi:DNA-binding MarR family transcriptional regulator